MGAGLAIVLSVRWGLSCGSVSSSGEFYGSCYFVATRITLEH